MAPRSVFGTDTPPATVTVGGRQYELGGSRDVFAFLASMRAGHEIGPDALLDAFAAVIHPRQAAAFVNALIGLEQLDAAMVDALVDFVCDALGTPRQKVDRLAALYEQLGTRIRGRVLLSGGRWDDLTDAERVDAVAASFADLWPDDRQHLALEWVETGDLATWAKLNEPPKQPSSGAGGTNRPTSAQLPPTPVNGAAELDNLDDYL